MTKIKSQYLLIINAIVVTTAFFILVWFTDNFWITTEITIIIALALNAIVFIPALRGILSNSGKLFLAAYYLLFIAIMYFAWDDAKIQGKFQKKNLLTVRELISEEILKSAVYEISLHTYDKYKNDNPLNSKISDVFYNKVFNNSLYNYELEFIKDDSVNIYIDKVTDNEINIVGIHNFIKGSKEDYHNYDGNKGLLEVAANISENGIIYERRN